MDDHNAIIAVTGLLFTAYSVFVVYAVRNANRVQAQLAELLQKDHVHRHEFERLIELNREEIAKIYGVIEVNSNRITALEVKAEIIRNSNENPRTR